MTITMKIKITRISMLYCGKQGSEGPWGPNPATELIPDRQAAARFWLSTGFAHKLISLPESRSCSGKKNCNQIPSAPHRSSDCAPSQALISLGVATSNSKGSRGQGVCTGFTSRDVRPSFRLYQARQILFPSRTTRGPEPWNFITQVAPPLTLLCRL